MDTTQIFCQECHGTNFKLQHGLHYCTGCQTQSQDHGADVVVDDDTMGVFDANVASTIRKKSFRKGNRAAKEKEREKRLAGIATVSFTSIDALSYVLLGWIDELEELGANPALKDVTMGIWSRLLRSERLAFLDENEVAAMPRQAYFNDKQVRLTGRCNMLSSKRISMILKPKLTRKERRDRDLLKLQILDDDDTSEARRIRSRKRKRFLQVAANEQVPENDTSESDTSFMSRVSFMSDSAGDTTGGEEDDVRTTSADEVDESLVLGGLEDKLDESGLSSSAVPAAVRKELEWEVDPKNPRTVAQAAMLNRLTGQPQHHKVAFNRITMQTAFSVLALAMLLSEDNDFTLADLFYWLQNDVVSLFSAASKVPKRLKLQGSLKTAFVQQSKPLHSYSHLFSNVSRIGSRVQLESVEFNLYQSFEKALHRYAAEFSLPKRLPEELLRFAIGRKWIELNFTFPHLDKSNKVGYMPTAESKALAFLLFGLKYLYGMDGSSEEICGQNAKRSRKKVFDVCEWMRLSRRRAFVATRFSHQLHDRIKVLFPRTEMTPETRSSLFCAKALLTDKTRSNFEKEKWAMHEQAKNTCNVLRGILKAEKRNNAPDWKEGPRFDIKTSRKPLFDLTMQILSESPDVERKLLPEEKIPAKDKDCLRKLIEKHEHKLGHTYTPDGATEVTLDTEWNFDNIFIYGRKKYDRGVLPVLFSERKKKNVSNDKVEFYKPEYWTLQPQYSFGEGKVDNGHYMPHSLDHDLRVRLPDNFLWVLEYFSAVTQVPAKIIFKELILLEKELTPSAPEMIDPTSEDLLDNTTVFGECYNRVSRVMDNQQRIASEYRLSEQAKDKFEVILPTAGKKRAPVPGDSG